jgi:hypothetical protein
VGASRAGNGRHSKRKKTKVGAEMHFVSSLR